MKQDLETIRSVSGLPRNRNGLEGSVSAITVDSKLSMLVLGLKRLQKNANNFNYNSVKLSSCMTLLTEKIYSAVNKKQATQTLVTYAQTFATAIKESIKSVPKLSVHYFTSRERCARISVTTKRLDISKMKVQAF